MSQAKEGSMASTLYELRNMKQDQIAHTARKHALFISKWQEGAFECAEYFFADGSVLCLMNNGYVGMKEREKMPIQLAKQLAHDYHGEQMYGDKPYMWHLMDVADSLSSEPWEQAGDIVPYYIVAILHDILEDTPCTENVLREHFAEHIVNAVVAITKIKGEAYDAYMQKVKGNKIASVVKKHDTMCNLRASMSINEVRWMKKYSKQLSILLEA